MSEFEYRIISANGYENRWHDVVDGEKNGIAGARVEFRAKPLFEPGHFVLVQDHRDDEAPWLVKWFDENPGNDWERAVVIGDDFS